MPMDKYDVLVELKALTKDFNKKMEHASKQIAKFGKTTKTSVSSIHDINGKLVKLNGVIDKNGKILRTSASIIEDTRKRFKMYYLSMLFGGMMIKRTMESILRSTVSTFMKLTEGQTLASEGLNRLSVGFEYLKYSIGEAIATSLLPYIPQIVEFISRIADFVQQHPQAVFWGIAGALAFGTAVLAIGQWGLFIDGMTRFVEAGIGTKFIASLKGIGSLVPFFTLLGKAVIAMAAGFALGVLFAKMWKSNFLGIGTIINGVIASMLTLIGAIYTAGKIVKEGLVKGFKFAFYRIGYYISKITFEMLKMIESMINAVNRVAGRLGLPKISTSGISKLKSEAFEREVYYWHKADTVAKQFKGSIEEVLKGFETFRGRVRRTYAMLTPAPTINPMKVITTPVLPSSAPSINITVNAQGADNEKLAKQIADQIDSALAKYGNLGR